MGVQLNNRGRISTATFAGLVFALTTAVTLTLLRQPREAEGVLPEVGRSSDPRDLWVSREIAPRPPFGAQERRNVEAFARTAPSVVHVDAVGVALYVQTADQDPPDGVGSGFVWSDRGHIVTSLHVVRDRGGATSVTLADGSRWPAEFVGMDEQNDLAVLSIPAPSELLHPVMIGSSSDLLIGQGVLAIGNPFGLDHTLTLGVVSGLDRSIRGNAKSLIDGAIQHDAAIHPGSSGGPLLDTAGRLIGINTAVSSGSSNLAFAIPVGIINESVPQIIADGFESWPELGLVFAPDQTGLEMLRRSGWMKETACDFGVIVVEVQPGSPAETAGILPIETAVNMQRIGDVIVGVNGIQLRSREDLTLELSRCEPGAEVQLDLRRRGEPHGAVLVYKAR